MCSSPKKGNGFKDINEQHNDFDVERLPCAFLRSEAQHRSQESFQVNLTCRPGRRTPETDSRLSRPRVSDFL